MRISINNNAELSNKYIRFIKWKLINLGNKFDQINYTEVFIRAEGSALKTYTVTVRFGIHGKVNIIKDKSKNLGEILANLTSKIHRKLADSKRKKIKIAPARTRSQA